MLKLLALFLFALSLEAQVFPAKARRMYSSSSAPSSGDCAGLLDTDKWWTYKSTTTVDYRCRQTGVSTFAWVDIASASGATGDVQGGGSLSTAGALAYVASASTLAQDTAITRVAAGILGMTKIRAGAIYPASDSTTAVQVTKADASTAVVTVDTTNSRVGIGTTPTVTLDVKGLARFYDATASTGVTTVTVQAGAGQSSTNLQEWKNNDGTTLANVTSAGKYLAPDGSSSAPAFAFASATGRGVWNNGGFFQITTPVAIEDGSGNQKLVLNQSSSGFMEAVSGGGFRWASGSNPSGGTADASLSRIGPGVIGAGTGAAGSVAGTVRATKFQIGGGTSSFPMFDNSGTSARVVLADGSGLAPLVASQFVLSGGASFTSGSGSPEGVVTASVGSFYSRTDGGSGTSAYFKESGSGNTGWVARGAGGGSGVADPGANGIMVRTSSGVSTARKLVAGTGIGPITPDDGVSGDITIPVDFAAVVGTQDTSTISGNKSFTGQVDTSGASFLKLPRASGAPSTGCTASGDVGKVYSRSDAGAAAATLYICANTAASTYAWELLGAGGSGISLATAQAGAFGSATTGGTSTAYTLALTPTLGSYTDKMSVRAKFNATNGANPTINIDSLGPRKILRRNGSSAPSAPQVGQIQATAYSLIYDSALDGGTGAFVLDAPFDLSGGGVSCSGGVCSLSLPSIQVGAFSSIPSCSTTNWLYKITSGFYSDVICDGSSTKTYLTDGGLAVTPPTPANWTSTGSPTIVTTNGAITSTVAGAAGTALKGQYASVSATYTKTFLVDFGGPINDTQAGNVSCAHVVGWRSSGASTVQGLTVKWRGNGGSNGTPAVAVETFDSSGNVSARDGILGDGAYGQLVGGGRRVWVKLADDNTNKSITVSVDGVNFASVYSAARTAYFTPDQVFFGISANPSTVACSTSLVSYN